MNRRLAMAGAAVLVALFVGLAGGWWLAGDDSSDHGAATPADDSVEAGFVRDMAVHHTQAVEMADIIRQRTADPTVAQLATDIVLTQQSQIGRFGGWLDQWGLPATSSSPPMAWAGHDMGAMPGMSMPGMAQRSDVDALSTLPTDAAEVLFLELMIAHHVGGVDMAEQYLALGTRPEVVRIAESIVRSQTSEIAAMNELLAARS